MKKPKSVGAKKPDKKENYVELPNDFPDPKVEDGKTFESVATIRKDNDGYCVVALDGVPMDDENKEPEPEPEGEPDDIGTGAKKMMGDY